MVMPVLQTKLKTPPPRPRWVVRPRLLARLNQSLDVKFLLVSAPAGYGKTTLIADWLTQLPPGSSSAWLALDNGDNDPHRFLTYLIAALGQVQDGFGASVKPLLQAPQLPPDDIILTVLINEIAAIPRPFVLVLDDYHAIHTLAIHEQLAYLLEHQPESMHLALITREDPLLPVARLRAQGQVVEIHQEDLRFTHNETAEFLKERMQLPLTAENIATLERRTEGWIAGLQLAALSLQGRNDLNSFIQAFSGSTRFILDYLIEEVFARQTPAVQEFLLRTSILGRLYGPLCDAVTQQNGCQALLVTLDQANLFIIPLDQSRSWYRYHRLFADLLQHRLRTARPELVAELHQRASRWFANAGLKSEAIHHALAAQSWGEAARLIGQAADGLLNQGEIVTLIGWCQELPHGLLLEQPALGLAYVWALLLSGRYADAEPFLAHYEAAAQSDPPLLGQVANAQAFAARAVGDNPRVIEKSEQALALLPESEMSSRCLLAINLGLVYWHEGRLREVGPVLDQAEALAVPLSNEYGRLTAKIFRARTLASQGALRQAAEMLQKIVQTDSNIPILALAHYDLVCIYQEWAEDERAWRHLEKGIEICLHSRNREFENGGRLQKALLLLDQGRHDAALAEIESAHTLAKAFNPVTQARSFAAHALVLLAMGEPAEARIWIEKMPADGDPHSLYRYADLMRARLLLAEGSKAEAAAELAVIDEKAASAGWGYARVAILALRALAAGSDADALPFLREALRLGEPEGFLRTFAEAGPSLVPLLREAARQGCAPGYVGKILAAFPDANRPETAALVEPLSTRELEVLRLVAAGLSNREIARHLVVSTGTVKTHIHHICGKLGVRNRTEAAMQAKELNLV